jgi:hypothetical protein
VTLPVWLLLAALVEWRIPAASYLFTVPVLAAALVLAWGASRTASLVVFGVAALFWLGDTVDVLRFMVPMFGRLPIVTPVFAYAVLMLPAALMLLPPLAAAAATKPGPRRRKLVPLVLAGVLVVSAAWVSFAPAYTSERPLRRDVRYVQDEVSGRSFWEIAGNERMPDPPPGPAPRGWRLENSPGIDLPIFFFGGPFVYRAAAADRLPAPATISSALQRRTDAAELEIRVVPQEPGATVWFILPRGTIPAESNLVGLSWQSRWTARYVAPPPEGVVFHAVFDAVAAESLAGTIVAVGGAWLPEGSGWQRLPVWLPQSTVVWRPRALFVLPIQL